MVVSSSFAMACKASTPGSAFPCSIAEMCCRENLVLRPFRPLSPFCPLAKKTFCHPRLRLRSCRNQPAQTHYQCLNRPVQKVLQGLGLPHKTQKKGVAIFGRRLFAITTSWLPMLALDRPANRPAIPGPHTAAQFCARKPAV